MLPQNVRLSGPPGVLEDPLNLVSAGLALALIGAALLAPVLSPYPPDLVAPDQQWQSPSLDHWMGGTDQYGRDVLSRVLYGARVSLFVGTVTVVLAMIIGVGLGALAGYFGRIVDEILMRLVDVFMSIPGIVLALAIYRIAQFARVTRGSVLSVMAQDYIGACRAIGMSGLLGNVILTEATLSFLGMGIQPPTASWGVMIADGNEYLMFAPWISIFPGVFLLITMMAFNLLGDGVRDHFDPRGRSVL